MNLDPSFCLIEIFCVNWDSNLIIYRIFVNKGVLVEILEIVYQYKYFFLVVLNGFWYFSGLKIWSNTETNQLVIKKDNRDCEWFRHY